jgi:predicted RNase H-like HicB family nuclease
LRRIRLDAIISNSGILITIPRFETGTPAFLIKKIRQHQIDITEFERHPIGLQSFDSYDIEHIDEGWYVGKLKEVPGVFSQGATLEESEDNIREAYQLMMAEEELPSRSGIQTKEVALDV